MKPEKFYNKKEKKEMWRLRFQINRKPFYVTADTLKELNEIVDEIRGNERRTQRNLDSIESLGPTVQSLLDKVLPTIDKHHQRKICERVFAAFLQLLPKDLRVKNLKKLHFQAYINWRSLQTGKQRKKPVKMDTIYKELYALSSALSQGENYWAELEDWEKPKLPKFPEKKQSRQETRRKRIVSPEQELSVLLAELRKSKKGKQTKYTEEHRRRLADDLEFRYETGLRRKEVVLLEKKKYFPKEHALRDVIRWKTGTITKFFPLTPRAEEIIKNRLAAQNGSDSPYIFTPDGKPIPSDYRTLKRLCAKLKIPYGRFTEDGFVAHDLRHNFASEVIQHGDIETVRELLGHSNIEQTGDYLHTDERRLRETMRKRSGIDLRIELVALYKDVRRKRIDARTFIEKIKELVF